MMLNSFLSPVIISFLSEVEDLGFSLCIVGGAVRDYLGSGIKSNDLDFEIRANKKIGSEEWPLYYERLLNFFAKKNLKIVSHPYLITKVVIDEWSLEFSSPRLEVFEDLEEHTHHNFKALLSSDLSYKDSFKRRDFTLNAIGLELNCKNNLMVIIDPYDGKIDLDKKKLNIIDEDFFRDSVRFLRLIRFSIKYNFFIEPSLENSLTKFNLTALSKFHFSSEMFKTDTAKFLNLFKMYVRKCSLLLPKDYNIWLDEKFIWPTNKLHTKEDILAFVFSIDENSAVDIQRFFSLSEKKMKALKRLRETND